MLGLMRSLHSRKASRFVIFVAVAALACAVYLALKRPRASLSLARRVADVAGRDALFAQRNHRIRTSAIFLEDRSAPLGAIEAVNGLLLFGLTTALLSPPFTRSGRFAGLNGSETRPFPTA